MRSTGPTRRAPAHGRRHRRSDDTWPDGRAAGRSRWPRRPVARPAMRWPASDPDEPSARTRRCVAHDRRRRADRGVVAGPTLAASTVAGPSRSSSTIVGRDVANGELHDLVAAVAAPIAAIAAALTSGHAVDELHAATDAAFLASPLRAAHGRQHRTVPRRADAMSAHHVETGRALRRTASCRRRPAEDARRSTHSVASRSRSARPERSRRDSRLHDSDDRRRQHRRHERRDPRRRRGRSFPPLTRPRAQRQRRDAELPLQKPAGRPPASASITSPSGPPVTSTRFRRDCLSKPVRVRTMCVHRVSGHRRTITFPEGTAR